MSRTEIKLSMREKRRTVAFFMPQGKHERPTVFGDPRYWKGDWPQDNEVEHALIVLLGNAQKGMRV